MSRYGKMIKARGGYQELPDVDVPTGSDVAAQAMSSASAGATAGGVFGPVGSIAGGVIGGAIGAFSGNKRRKEMEREQGFIDDANESINTAKSRYGSGFSNDETLTYMANDGAFGDDVNNMGALVAEYEGVPGGGTEILGTPMFDVDQNLYDFIEKSEAPHVTHEQANGENPDNLLPTKEGKESGMLPPEIANKPSLDPGDVIINTQGKKDYNYTKRLIKQTKEGSKSAALELEKRLNQMPKEGVENEGSMKKYKKGVNSVGSLLKYTGTANNLIRGFEDTEKVERRYLDGEDQKYERDVANEESKMLESRNAAAQSMRGKAMSAGQAQGYASDFQGRYDKANADLESRERGAKRSIEANNIARRNQEQAQNLQLDNTYDDMEAQARAVRDSYRDQGFSEVSAAAQMNERTRYQMMRDEALDKRDQDMIDQGLFDTKNRVYSRENGSTYRRTNRKGTRRYN